MPSGGREGYRKATAGKLEVRTREGETRRSMLWQSAHRGAGGEGET